MAQTPDVRVRLSAEGVEEVVNAMKRVQAEAQKTDGLKALQKGFADLKSEILGGFGIAAAVAGIAELGKKALENAVNIARMSEKLGTSTELLSVLTVAARYAGVEQEQLGSGLQKLAKAQDQAAQGSTKQLDAFKRLGISMRDIKTNDPGQMFVLISQKLAHVESGSQRAAIAQNLLGKSGANLIPVMNELADGGFEKVAAKAQRMGLVLDDETAEGIKRAHEALIDLGNIALGVATQFEAGFLPKAADAMEQLGNAISNQGVSGMKKLGEYAGYVAKFIVFVFVAAGQILGSVAGSISEAFETAFKVVVQIGGASMDALKAFSKGDFANAKAIFAKGGFAAANTILEGQSTQKDIYSHLGGQLKADWSGLTTSSDPIGNKPGGGSAGGDGNVTAIAKARIAFLEAQSNNELAILKTKNQLEGQENDRNYRDGFTSLQDYYDKRAALINKETDDEIASLKRKIEIVKQEPEDDTVSKIKKQQQLDALQTQIDQKELERQGKLKANDNDRYNAKRQHNIQELETQAKIAGIEGDRDRAAQLALDAEIAKTEELLQKQGVAAAVIKQILNDMRTAGEGKLGFDAASRSGNIANNDLNLAKRDIQRQADTGQILGISAQAQILALERERVAVLRQIGKEMEDNAEKAKDPSLIQQAKDFNAAVDDLEASTNQVGRAMATLTNDVMNQGITAFSTFFADSVTGAKLFSQAWADMGKAFQQIVAQMIAKLIEMYLMMLLMNLIAPSSGDGGGQTDTVSGGGSLIMFPDRKSFASGGYTGDLPTNRAAGVVHGKEFVVNAPATARFRPLLEAMNAGGTRGISSSSTRWGYAAGGYVADAPGMAGPGTIVNIDTQGQPASQTQRRGPDGSTIIDVIVGQVAASIAKGGQVHQAIQNTYGLKRSPRKVT